jgi:conjugative relaxase-like TrwC/TraI family protein
MLSVRVIVSRTPADEQAVADYLFGRQGKYFAESAVHTEWYGSLARRWGLYLNPVDEVDFRMLLEGVHPRLGLALARGPGGKHCPGTDLTFSAPKSVSVLLALGCEEVRAAHRHAVREALAFVEAYCIRYRLKRGGRVLWRQSRAALFAVFEHETSRAGDPQLHSHAILLNVTYDKEYGKYRALRNDEIYRAQLAAGLVYRAALAEALRGYGFGIRITDPGKGLFEVAGVPDAAVEALSTRRAEIRELVERWRAEGRYGAASEAELHELACLKSRRPKERDRLDRAAVESVLEALGYDREGVLAATAHEAGDLPPDLPAREVLRAALARLGEHASFWTPAETFREVLRLGLGRLTVRDVEAALAEALREGEVLCLTPGDPASGTVLLTTPDLLEAEREFARLVEAGRDSVRPLLPDPPPPPAGLGRDQVEAYRFVLSAPHRVGGVVGMAGTGKSVLLEALVGALREAGYTVAAVAPTGRAADELRRLGVDADTVDAFLLRHGVHVGPAGDSGVRPPDPPLVAEGPDVLLVDESSMLGAVKAAALLKAFPGSRVVLVGDPRQLRPVEAGSPFENVVRAGILPHARLTRIIRQTDPAYREAVYAAARDPAEALKVLEGLGAVRQAEGLADVAEAVWEHGGPGEAVAVTPLREQAKALNGLIRAEAVRRGLVSGEGQTFEVWERLDSPLVREGDLLLAPRARRPMEVLDRRAGFIVRTSDGAEWDLRRLSGWQAYRVRTLELAPGDRIVFTRNDRRLGVRNGQVATVRAVSQDRVVVDLDRQDRVLTFNPHEFQYFDYAYALTTHKAQGISVNTIICDLPASWADARQFYVQVSRGHCFPPGLRPWPTGASCFRTSGRL